jgi:hypothetical protein
MWCVRRVRVCRKHAADPGAAAYVLLESVAEDATNLLRTCFERDSTAWCTVADVGAAGWAPGAAGTGDALPAAASAMVDITSATLLLLGELLARREP